MSEDRRRKPGVIEGERTRIAKSLALSVLKRRDPGIRSILVSSAHVACYRIEGTSAASTGTTSERSGSAKRTAAKPKGRKPPVGEILPWRWTKMDIEGPLHVVERESSIGRVSSAIAVMNRKGMDDFLDEVPLASQREDFEVDQNARLVSYRSVTGEVYGIWFARIEEMERVVNVLRDLRDQGSLPPLQSNEEGENLARFFPSLTVSAPSPPPPEPSSGDNEAGKYLMGLLGVQPTLQGDLSDGVSAEGFARAIHAVSDPKPMSSEEFAKFLHDTLCDRERFTHLYEEYLNIMRSS